jgi:hypothetical protein
LLHLTGWLHPSISNVKNEIRQEQEHVACNENEIERYEISRLDRDTGYGMDMVWILGRKGTDTSSLGISLQMDVVSL